MSSPRTPPTEVPRRSLDQRREALAQANRVRMQRALLKADLKRGSVSIKTLIGDPPQCLTSAKVVEVLMALPGYGRIKAARLLEHCHVSPKKSVGGLTEGQRDALIRALEKSGSSRFARRTISQAAISRVPSPLRFPAKDLPPVM